MGAMPLRECLGTVVVHRDDAVTCTRDTCPRNLPLEMWFSHHTSFVTCITALDCPHCGFDAPVQSGHGDGTLTSIASGRSRSRGRHLDSARSRHPSSRGPQPSGEVPRTAVIKHHLWPDLTMLYRAARHRASP